MNRLTAVTLVAVSSLVLAAPRWTQDKPDPFEDPDHKPAKNVVTNARTASSQTLFVLDNKYPHPELLVSSPKTTLMERA